MQDLNPRDLERWSAGHWTAPPRGTIRDVVHDHRQVRPGSLFVALTGTRQDGHRFVPDAFQAGAAAALVRRGCRALREIGPLLETDDPLHALTDLAAGHRRRLPGAVIAVTGSVGKTTVKEMLAAILRRAGRVASSPGNWNTDIGLALSLLRMDRRHAFGVFELGISHPGEMEMLGAMAAPDWGVVTPIGASHLEFFGDVARVASEKAHMVAAVSPAGGVVLHRDDPWYPVLAAAARGRIIPVSSAGADAAYHGRLTQGILAVREAATGKTWQVPLRVPVPHMAENALRCWALARTLDVPPEAVRDALETFLPPAMRGEILTAGPVTLVSDVYNAGPLSMRSALEAFTHYPPARGRWLVLGAMRELGPVSEQEHHALGRSVAAGDWRGLFTVGTLAAGIAHGAEAAGFPRDRLYACGGIDEVDDLLRARLRPGDAVLLKASRSETFERLVQRLSAAFAPSGEAGGITEEGPKEKDS